MGSKGGVSGIMSVSWFSVFSGSATLAVIPVRDYMVRFRPDPN